MKAAAYIIRWSFFARTFKNISILKEFSRNNEKVLPL